MHESLKNTVKALSLCPSDKTTLYNLALVQQSYAQQIADLTQEQRDSKSMHHALEYLEFGQRTFRQLISVDEHTLYDKKIVEQRERYGETLRTQLERKLVEQVQFEEQKREKLELAKKRREEDIAKQRAIEDEKRKLEQIEREKMEEARRKLMEKVREDNLMMASLQVDEDDIDEEKKSNKRGKKRKERDEEQPEEEDEKDALLRKKDKKVDTILCL